MEIIVAKEANSTYTSKTMEVADGSIEIIHDISRGEDTVTVLVNGIVEFYYDVNNPETEIVGNFAAVEMECDRDEK